MKTSIKLAFTAALFTSFFSPAMAQTQDTSMMVNGVCGMCEYVIESAVLDLEGAEVAEWNKDTKVLSLRYDSEKLDLQQISDAVTLSGYDTEYNTATDSAYYSLHKCCYYRDPKVVKEHELNEQ